MHDATEREARLQELHTADSQAVQEWLVKVQRETDDQGKLLLNKEQFAFVKMVAERVMRELDCEGDDNLDAMVAAWWTEYGKIARHQGFEKGIIRRSSPMGHGDAVSDSGFASCYGGFVRGGHHPSRMRHTSVPEASRGC